MVQCTWTPPTLCKCQIGPGNFFSCIVRNTPPFVPKVHLKFAWNMQMLPVQNLLFILIGLRANYQLKGLLWPQNQYSVYDIWTEQVMRLQKLSPMHIKPVFHCTPDQASQNCFSCSILTQLKFPLIVLSVSPIGTFPRGKALGWSVKSTLPVPHEKCGCAPKRISCHKFAQLFWKSCCTSKLLW